MKDNDQLVQELVAYWDNQCNTVDCWVGSTPEDHAQAAINFIREQIAKEIESVDLSRADEPKVWRAARGYFTRVVRHGEAHA